MRTQPAESQIRIGRRPYQVARLIILGIRKDLRPTYWNFVGVRDRHRAIRLCTAATGHSKRARSRGSHPSNRDQLREFSARYVVTRHVCPSCNRVCSARRIVSRPTTPTM
jgi:hypothetical protein